MDTRMDDILEKQSLFFKSGQTRDIGFRKRQLKLLYQVIKEHEDEILSAIKADLNKEPFEAYATEVGLVLEEIRFLLKHMKRFLKPKRVRTPITQFPSVSKIYKEPYGKVLIISPWNYPFNLTMIPLIGSMACGNTTVLKPSKQSPETTKLIQKLISEHFDEGYIAVIQGNREEKQALLDKKFDLIFFTGSKRVGKIVMEKAAQNLTPVVLELGGKSPCIVDEKADIKLAAKRIAWGKGTNAGQTCVAPDYLLVNKKIKQAFIEEMMKEIKLMFTDKPEENPAFPKIINKKHFDRLSALLKTGEVIYGGGLNETTNQIGMTLMDHVSWEDPIMQEEIFGPILPILEYEDLDAIIEKINERPKPLALYLFTKDKEIEKKVIGQVAYGGGCINDTLVHLGSSYMGFGGVGESGMGDYHGRASIEAFSHKKSVLRKSNWIDLPVRYPPFGDKIKSLRKLMK